MGLEATPDYVRTLNAGYAAMLKIALCLNANSPYPSRRATRRDGVVELLERKYDFSSGMMNSKLYHAFEVVQMLTNAVAQMDIYK